MLSFLFQVIILSFLFWGSVAFPETFFVKPDGDNVNDGNSWDTAFCTLTKAMDEVTSGDVVCVAEGDYREGAVLQVPENVILYGGFSGMEIHLDQRDIENYGVVVNCIAWNNEKSDISGFENLTNSCFGGAAGNNNFS